MDRRGQLTLETAVLLMVAINILLYMTLPVGRVSQRAVESIGVNALAVKAIDSIVQEANLVGISGEGAKGVIEVNLRKEFSALDCSGDSCSVTFSYYDNTTAFAKSDFGIQDYMVSTSNSYSNSADYSITRNFTGITLGTDTEVCMCFEWILGGVKVTGMNKTGGECVCDITAVLPEICDSADNDGDGLIDEGSVCCSDGITDNSSTWPKNKDSPDETCDDGNLDDGDSCSSTCQIELATCGNTLSDIGEACDLTAGFDNCTAGMACDNLCRCNTCYTNSGGVCSVIFDSCKCVNDAWADTSNCDSEVRLTLPITAGWNQTTGDCAILQA